MTTPLIAFDAERAFIAGIANQVNMGLSSAADPYFRTVPVEYFAAPEHRAIWQAMTDLADSDVDPEPAAICTRLEESGAAKLAPLVRQIMASMDMSPSVHVGTLKDRATRRRLNEAARQVEAATVDLEQPIADLIDASERIIFGATTAKSTALATPEPVKKRLLNVIELMEAGGYKGTPTGYRDLDAMLTGGGVLPGQLIVVAGATSMGKSAFATGITASMGIDGKHPVLYASIEMTADDNALRLVCHEARADLKAVSEGRLTDHDRVRVAEATNALHAAPLYLHDSATTVNQIRSAARRLKAETGDLALVVVDHIQDMEGPGDNRREQIGGIARSLKALAKELDTAIIAVSQLRRLSNRSDYTPTIGDLKESGDVENSADSVWLLYRPEYYQGPQDDDGNDLRGKAQLIVAKQRNGQTGIVPLRFIPHCVRFDDEDRQQMRVVS